MSLSARSVACRLYLNPEPKPKPHIQVHICGAFYVAVFIGALSRVQGSWGNGLDLNLKPTHTGFKP
jgi:hypothetical protein